MQIKDLTVDELKMLIRDTVEEVLQDMLADPDEEQVVRREVVEGLLAQRAARESGESGLLSSEDVVRRLGLGMSEGLVCGG